MIRKLTTGFLLSIAIFTTSLISINAQGVVSQSLSPTPVPTVDVYYESVNPPDGMSYLLKRISEKINLFFSFSNENKIKNYRKLVNVRLSELKFIIEKRQMGYFEKSTQRYFTATGQLVEFLVSSNIKGEFMPVKEELITHIPVLIKLRDSFDFGTAEWRFVEDDINYVKGYIDDLSTK